MTQLHLGRQRLDRDRVLSLDHFVCVFDTCTTLLFANFNKSAYAVLKICWALALSIIYPSASVCKTQSVHPYMIVSLSNCHHSRTAQHTVIMDISLSLWLWTMRLYVIIAINVIMAFGKRFVHKWPMLMFPFLCNSRLSRHWIFLPNSFVVGEVKGRFVWE